MCSMADLGTGTIPICSQEACKRSLEFKARMECKDTPAPEQFEIVGEDGMSLKRKVDFLERFRPLDSPQINLTKGKGKTMMRYKRQNLKRQEAPSRAEFCRILPFT
ncbi:hypothetical protein R1flu_023922 [Riccia fluitans]|uniref:Uncharacterized protein n=1 Tax=Riccia fluitans TaxID=41844 RepID=A0ABD1XTE3_9MARC